MDDLKKNSINSELLLSTSTQNNNNSNNGTNSPISGSSPPSSFSRRNSGKSGSPNSNPRRNLNISVKVQQPIVVVNQQSFNIQLFATNVAQQDPVHINNNTLQTIGSAAQNSSNKKISLINQN